MTRARPACHLGSTRAQLDADRAAAEARVDAATAVALQVLDERAARERRNDEVSSRLGGAVRGLLSLGVGIDRTVRLLQLSEAEVRRLARPTAADGAEDGTGDGRELGAAPGDAEDDDAYTRPGQVVAVAGRVS